MEVFVPLGNSGLSCYFLILKNIVWKEGNTLSETESCSSATMGRDPQ